MSVSVVISTYNNPTGLRMCLLGMMSQTVLPDQIIIADDGSDRAGYGFLSEALFSSLPIEKVWHPDRGWQKNLILNITKSEILLSGQQLARAEQSIEKVLTISPGNYPASIIQSKILSAKKEIIKAEEVLRDLLIKKNRDPSLWMQLSEVQRAGKNIVGYHLSRGEYYLLIGDFENALNQFQFALRLSGNSFQASETIITKIKFAQERLGNKRGF